METHKVVAPAADVHQEKAKPDISHVEKLREQQVMPEFDPEIDRRVTRKFDLHIMPWLFGIWLLAFIDRSNIGNAAIDGLKTDLDIATGTKFNISLLVFYIPYILVDIPSNWIVKRIRAGFYLPALITAWGIVSTCIGFTRSFAGLVVTRMLLGLFEGGLLGAIVIYLAMFYRRHQMMYRIGLFYCAAPLSGAFGGFLATGLAKIRYHGYNRWPWIFFIEGVITVVFGVICFFMMPHTPAQAKFLTGEERAVAMQRMVIDSHGATTVEDVNEEKFQWHWVKMALLAPQTIFCSLAWFFLLVPLYSYSLFLPTIITGMGFETTTAQLFTVPPYILSFILVLVTSYSSDRIKARGPIMVAGCIVAIAGYIMLLVAKENSVSYAGTFLVAAGVFPSSPIVMGWLSNNLAPHYVRATGIGFEIAFANCAAFIASFIYLSKDAPRYFLGHSLSLAALVLCLITVCTQMIYCRWENRKRERGDRDDRLQYDAEHLLGHRHPAFRYTL
ncbi:uncharacterized protein N7482_010036 [Penicillium canariense]|uniref:Major facilitator superfamily (MFS) profile domain-containing protein n=1 Tax=Penicillium canariense TaxID=189055 RepID=A0A9W9HNQ2_9EURO|nr:uncharacterized protein N7482_010036 [Penicillium canariense]KAJ5153558.1 hypothetical protein N7482_010036 [Penicillium canariense]